MKRQMSFALPLLAETPQDSSKRKRHTQHSASLPQQVTPNPKPRKYAKQLAIPESPTRSTFNAIPRERSHRSVTPIPPYEPPSVVLTSPREVMAAPTFTNKRKSKSKVHARPGSIKIIPVKKELPDIDLSTPMPPPSPTDDPILLSGPFGPPTSTPSRLQSIQDCAFVPSVSESVQTDDVGGSDSLMDVHPSDADVAPVELPTFNLDDLPPSSDVWSDSDDDNRSEIGPEAMEEEGEDEFTGRWKTLLVKTKQDPPSSATRARMEQWGRPVSPFPEEAKSIQKLDEEEDERPESESRVNHTVVESDMKTNDLLEEASNDDNSDQEAESSFVKITSADPRAAARAAAILKLVSRILGRVCLLWFNSSASMIMIVLRKLQNLSVDDPYQTGCLAMVLR